MEKMTFQNGQLALLPILNYALTESEMAELKALLLDFKAKRAFRLINEQWEKNGWTQETMDEWLGEHNRTPYVSQEKHLISKQKN